MSRISVRGIAVASATAVTAVGAVVGISGGGDVAQAENVDGLGMSSSLAVLPIGHQVQALGTDVQAYAGAQQQQAQAAAQQAAAAKAAAQQRAQQAAAASRAAARAKIEKQQAAESSSSSSSSSASAAEYGSPQAIAQSILGTGSEYQCFSNIITRESGWNVHAENPSSGAYGLGQALPASKMAAYGPDYLNNPTTQIKWAVAYMDSRYGSPCDAWSFWQAHNWY